MSHSALLLTMSETNFAAPLCSSPVLSKVVKYISAFLNSRFISVISSGRLPTSRITALKLPLSRHIHAPIAFKRVVLPELGAPEIIALWPIPTGANKSHILSKAPLAPSVNTSLLSG